MPPSNNFLLIADAVSVAGLRVDEATLQLLSSDDPTKLGLRKVGRWKGVYSYEIGRQFRLLYSVNSRRGLLYS